MNKTQCVILWLRIFSVFLFPRNTVTTLVLRLRIRVITTILRAHTPSRIRTYTYISFNMECKTLKDGVWCMFYAVHIFRFNFCPITLSTATLITESAVNRTIVIVTYRFTFVQCFNIVHSLWLDTVVMVNFSFRNISLGSIESTHFQRSVFFILQLIFVRIIRELVMHKTKTRVPIMYYIFDEYKRWLLYNAFIVMPMR